MALRILKASDPLEVKQIVTCIYAQPGIGKTSLAFSAAAPLLLDFDGGSYRAYERKDTVQIATWADVAAISAEDLKPYKTLVLDTAGRALDWLSVDIVTKDPKMGRGGGGLSLQGFGVLKDRFKSFKNLIHSFGLDLVLIVHSDEQRSGDEVIERLDVQGGSKNEIYKSADLMGRILIRNGKRALTFNPTDTAFGKNPAQLPEFDVPNFATDPAAVNVFLARIIEQTKTTLNKQSEAQKKGAAELADWQSKFEEASDAEALNKLVPEVTEKASEGVRDNAKRILLKVGKAKGYAFDAKSKKFTPSPAQAAA